MARVSNAGGRAVGFLIGPLLIHEASDMPLFLAIHIALAAMPVVAALMYFPGAPTLAPSASAKLYGARGTENGTENKARGGVDTLIADSAVEIEEALNDAGDALRDCAAARDGDGDGDGGADGRRARVDSGASEVRALIDRYISCESFVAII